MRRFLLPLALLWFGCEPGGGARLYHTESKAPSLDAAAIENLETLGPTLIDKGVNFSVYSERAERIEVLLFDDPESNEPTRQFPLVRFGDVWNLHVEGIGLGQHYGYIAWGPNWTYDRAWHPGAIDGFKSDVDGEGNRFNPNKLLFDPYGKALHRDHDWGKGNLASGPRRTDVTYAAAAKSVVVQSRYTWSANEDSWRQKRQDPNWVGHRWNDLILYEVHPKGFSASTASAATHPGTFLGLAERADYLKDLGITAVELLPVFEKPLDGGYWGYATLSFFVPEFSYASRRQFHEVIDEFKAMVDALHQRGLEVILDVVYNHTGEGGFWRNKLQFDASPDRSLDAQVVNFDAKEVTGLYSYRGLDNAAWYALTDDKQGYYNNTGVGNETRCNHRPMRRLILDSLRYWVEEMHVDGFRFDLAPILGEKDGVYWQWENPKNNVLQEIIDDPVLAKHNVRIIAEPWGAGGYSLCNSFNGPGQNPQPCDDAQGQANNPFANGYGTRVGLFPAATGRPGVGWYEWNGRFRDWWRAFMNNDGWTLNSTEVKNGGFFLTGSYDWYQWNGRGPHASVNFVTVHDGFTMYDLFSYNLKQNKCGPLNPICCSEPFSPFCEFDSGESNNRSRDWGQGAEAFKRQLMRNLFVGLLISHGTPMLYGGDEWMRTQLGNNNAYTTGGDNEFNWFDWGAWEANDERQRMHDFVRQLTRFRKERGYAFAPAEWGKGAPFAWKSPANTDQVNWNGRALMIHYHDATKGPELAILINMEQGSVDFTLPGGRSWKRLIDTQQYFDLPATLTTLGKPPRQSANIALDTPEAVPGATYGVPSRSIAVLEAR